MARRAARRDHERVAQRRAAFQIDGDDVLGLVVVQRGAGCASAAALVRRAFLGRRRRGFLRRLRLAASCGGFLGGGFFAAFLRGFLALGGLLGAAAFFLRLSGRTSFAVRSAGLARPRRARTKGLRAARSRSARLRRRPAPPADGGGTARLAPAAERGAPAAPSSGASMRCPAAAPPRWERGARICCQRRQRRNCARLSLPISQTNCDLRKPRLQRRAPCRRCNACRAARSISGAR